MPDNKLKQFHDSIKGNPNISGVPEDFNTFQSALKNPSTSKAFFDAISKNEAIGGLPKDYNTFASSLGIVEKKSSNGPTASSGMGVLLAGKGKPQKSVSEQIISSLPKGTPQQKQEEDGKYWERAKSALSTLGKSVIDGVAATSAEQVAIVSKTIDDEVRDMIGMQPLKKPIEQYQTYQWAQNIKGTTEKAFQPNPEFKGEIQEQVAQTAGDLLGLVATAFITKNPSSAIAKMGTKGLVKGLANSATRKAVTRELAKDSIKMLASPTGFLAAAQTGTRNYDEAKAKGATDDQANAMFWSTAITGGLANSLPVGALLNRFDKATGGKMKDIVVGGVVGGIEEAVTEGIEQIATNFAAKNIYDETRSLFEGVEESATMGGGIGFVLNAMGVKLGSIRNKYKDNPEKLAEIDQSIDYIKDIAEKEGQGSAIKLSKEEQVKADRYSKIVNDPESTPEEKDIASQKIQELTGQKIINAETEAEALNNLSEDAKIDIKLIDSEIDRLRQATNKSSDVDIKDELEANISDLINQKNSIINDKENQSGIPGQERIGQEPEQTGLDETTSEQETQASGVLQTQEVSPSELANTVLEEQPYAVEVLTEKPLSEREQQMITVPEEMPIESSKIGSWLKGIGEKVDKRMDVPIFKGLSKLLSTGDLNAIRAKEITDSETGATVDKVRSISTKIQNLVGKDKNSRELANTVMSVDRLDDKISKLATNDNYTAISEILEGKYTPEQIKAATDFMQSNTEPDSGIMDKGAFDSIVQDMSGITASQISDKRYEQSARVKSLVGKILNYDTIGKTRERVAIEPTVVSGSQSPMLTGSELAPAGVQSESRVKNIQTSADVPVELQNLRVELASMPNGQEILSTLNESIDNQKRAERELSKTDKGRKILEQAKKGRELIDSFSDWVTENRAATKIDARVGDVIAGNKGSYLKRSFKFWKDKKFEPSEALKNQALESVVEDMMIVELTQLQKSPEYNRLQGDAKSKYLTQIADDVRRKAKIELNTYLDEIKQKRKDGSGFFPNTKSEKVNGKVISFRKLIDESFLDLLGNVNDPISQFHDTVLAQAQIKAAANFHWILNEVTGKENIFDSREQLIEFNGTSDGFKQINDPNSILDGKWVSEDIYDVISTGSPTKDGTGYMVYRKVLSAMRKSKTIYNFFAGWTTNLIGGEVTLGANGITPGAKRTGKYLINRAKYVNNPEKLDADIQKDIDAMKDNGFWSTSVSAGTIRLLDDNYMDMTSYDRGDEYARSATRRWIDRAKRFDDNVVRNYSVIDDFTKLVFFREKKDVFSRKLYGKKFDDLSKQEQNIVHANVAERGKENIATMSRLPRIYHKIAKYPLGDFMAFRISAVKSGMNAITNALSDINQGYSNRELSPIQRKAYLEDGLKTLSGMLAAGALNSSFYGAIATAAMGMLSEKDEKVFEPVVEDGVDYGSKAEVYTDFKGTPAVNPQWMRGKNNVVVKDDGKGNIELLNISNKDPYDELFGLFLPRAGTDWGETFSGVIKETASPNMALNLLTNIQKGQDQWGRDIYNGDDSRLEKIAKTTGYALTEALVPPAIKNTAKETYKEIQQSKAVEGDTKKQINKKPVAAGEYFNALLKNSPMLLNRTYKVNLPEQYGFYAKEFFQDRPEKFEELDRSGKEKRYADLEKIRDGYLYLKRYSIVNNNPDLLESATEQMFKSARGISNEEKDFILYGEKAY